MTIIRFLPLVSSLFVICLGFFVFSKNIKSKLNLLFLLFCLSIGIWLFGTYKMFSVVTDEEAIFWDRFIYIGVVFIPIFMHHFSIAFGRIRTQGKFLLWGYLLALIFLLLSRTDYFVKDLYRYRWGCHTIAQPAHHIFLLVFWGYVVLLNYNVYRFYKTTESAIKRNQAKYVFVAFIVLFVIGACAYLPAYKIPILPFPFLSGLFFTIILGYAIAKYKLLDIRVVIRKIIAYAWIIIVISASIIGIQFLPFALASKIFLSIIIASSFAIFSPKIIPKTENAIRQVLYKDKYKYQDELRGVAGSIPTIYDMERLLKYTVETTAEAVECSPCSIMLMDSVTKSYSVAYSIGLPEKFVKRVTFYPDTEIAQKLRWGNRAIVKEELSDDDPVKERMDSVNAEVSVPIVRKDKLLGILNLNHKASGDIYSHEDLSLLTDISKYLAMAIENISYSEREHHQKLVTYLNNIAYALSHELKNKSQALRSTSQIILDMLPKETNVSPGLLELATLADGKIEEIDSLVKELLAYSNVQQTEGFTEIDLDRLLKQSLLIAEGEVKSKKIHVITKYTGAKIAHGDKGLIIQVFVSIIRNGIESMEEGGKLTIDISDKGDFWEIPIQDTGKGIPENHLSSIFEPFFTTKHDHTGLGLSIARRIIYDHEGDIKVESTEGKGTTLYVYLPKEISKERAKTRAIKRREDIAYDRIKTKDSQDERRKEEAGG